MNFIPLLVLWSLLAVTVLALFVWRKTVSTKEDDNLHIMDGSSVEKNALQEVVAQKLDRIDKWGKLVTIVVVVCGVILGGLFAWQGWIQSTRIE
jgi:hypothetical protein